MNKSGAWFVIVISSLLWFAGCGKHPPKQEYGPGVSLQRQEIVRTARSQIGARYRYGGCSAETGFDCSGFVQWVYAANGVRLPRETRGQFESSVRVGSTELAPGDLVFFGNRVEGPNHVGILTGFGTFIHCPSSGGRVREDRLSVNPWNRSFLGGCRVIP